ncbi:MAG: dihydroorotate dehydrogenase-like protein, partial [Actinobacteria bacterium]|nr:dihydroorotate dehydrogenase-like protein [Actinomycetota bacterium]
MIDLSCKYIGLQLKNPVIVGSSGLTSSLENLKIIAQKGAGAVVLKSIFEEQIKFEANEFMHSDNPEMKSWNNTFQGIVSKTEFYYDEAFEYLTSYAKEHTLNQYLSLISDAKKIIDIPVIASINCNTQYDWQYFAKRIQEAGADALELNVYLLPSDFEKTGSENEKVYFDIIREVKKFITIPISLKIGYYLSGLSQTALKLSETGIAGLTLFNRPYNPDIDIEKLQINTSNMFSNDTEYSHTLRWVALLAGKIKCDIAASTGIHNHETVIKQLLAGADAVHMVSVFYKHHFDILPQILSGIESWMKQHNFSHISEFKGSLSKKNVHNPASYERVQFLRLFSSVE